MDQFYLDTTQMALQLDSLTSSHPISVPVQDPTEINEIFDSISYDKVSFILKFGYMFVLSIFELRL